MAFPEQNVYKFQASGHWVKESTRFFGKNPANQYLIKGN
jgi:hypothetical protein